MSGSVDVTVAVPTYQGERHLHDCLASIAAQDLDGVEVLVADDGSTDDTVAIARSFGDRIPGLRVERNPQRVGPAANLNRCVRAAAGGWIKPMGQDDLLDDGCLRRLRDARAPGIPLVVSGRRYRYEGEVDVARRAACETVLDHSLVAAVAGRSASADVVCDAVLDLVAADRPHVNLVGEPVALLVERAAVLDVGGFDERLLQLWDYELPVRLGVHHGMAIVPEVLATFRVHGGSATTANFTNAGFRTTHGDRLRLSTAFASDPAYLPLRRRAESRRPAVDLQAKALFWAEQARGEARALPVVDERRRATAVVAESAQGLPWRRAALRRRAGRVVRPLRTRGRRS